MKKKYLLIGGAGFIGSHCLARLISDETNAVTVYDNLKTGRQWHLDGYRDETRVKVVRGDVKDIEQLKDAMKGHDTVYHLAANADIAKAVSEPAADFWEGTYLTQNILEAMRLTGVTRIVYTSGSGVYGDLGDDLVVEDRLTMLPTSPYGASKLASEGLISAYVHMFDMEGLILRFANVIGPHQTHGVAYDFVRRLLIDPGQLTIMGDGTQTKSYLHVGDVVDAVTGLDERSAGALDVFNVATEDYLTVTEIAEMVVASLGLAGVKFKYTGGKRGWKGDVPVVRFDSSKIRATGWSNRYTSREAMQAAIDSLIEDARGGKFDDD